MFTKFKAWKQARVIQASETAAEKAQAPRRAKTTRNAGPGRLSFQALNFVNSSHPQDATSVEAIGIIRSHVAKEIHATRRQRKRCDSWVRSEANSHTNGPEANLRRQLAELPGPTTLLDTGRRDQLNSLARPLNDAESFLIDHCMLVIQILRAALPVALQIRFGNSLDCRSHRIRAGNFRSQRRFERVLHLGSLRPLRYRSIISYPSHILPVCITQHQ